jgi:hypothetical protein
MYIQYLGEKFPPPHHNTVGVCNQVTFLILYYNSSRLLPLLEVINAPKQVPDIVDLTRGDEYTEQNHRIGFLRESGGEEE